MNLKEGDRGSLSRKGYKDISETDPEREEEK
jgi:hypothetical protein